MPLDKFVFTFVKQAPIYRANKLDFQIVSDLELSKSQVFRFYFGESIQLT